MTKTEFYQLHSNDLEIINTILKKGAYASYKN